MANFYYYKHPKTEKIYSDLRMKGFEKKPYISPDGEECELLKGYSPPSENKDIGVAIIDKNREVFEADPDFVKKCRPKKIKFQDGHIEKYDPTKHC